MFGQTFEPYDLVVIGLLTVLEGVLSIDNALVLGLLARRLPPDQRSKALTYGLIGAFVFRVIAIGLATFLLRWTWAKLLGGVYLIYVALRHFVPALRRRGEKPTKPPEPAESDAPPGHSEPISSRNYLFWSTVFVIEITDIAFAIDSILAAIALVTGSRIEADRPHPKLWVIVTGGMLGVVMMRFAAMLFMKLLDRFPRFETSAYLLIIVIGGKLLLDWALNQPEHPHTVDFHNYRRPEFWTLWLLMVGCLLLGFIPKTKSGTATIED